MLSGHELALAGLAAVAAGLINALAGGGTLDSFPTLIAMGIPPVIANITNTVALCPGYLGGALAQRADLRGQGRRLLILVPAAIIGGVAGGNSCRSPSVHRHSSPLVPFLILMAAGLLAVQDRVKAWITAHAVHDPRTGSAGRETAGCRRAVLPVRPRRSLWR